MKFYFVLIILFYSCGTKTSQKVSPNNPSTMSQQLGTNNIDPNANQSHKLFCTLILQIPEVQTSFNKEVNNFCSQGNPTSLFSQQLVQGAYQGSNNPPLIDLNGGGQAVNGGNESEYFGASSYVARSPSAKSFFDNSLNLLNTLAKGVPQGGVDGLTPGLKYTSVQQQQLSSQLMKGHWLIGNELNKTVAGFVPVNSKFQTSQKSYALQENAAYLITSNSIQADPTSTIQEAKLFVALLQVGNQVISHIQSSTRTKNLGSHQTAVQEIKSSITQGVLSSFSNSALSK